MLGPVAFEMDLPECANFPLSARAPFLYFDGGMERWFGHTYERIVIDTRTRAIYKFPEFSCRIVSSSVTGRVRAPAHWCFRIRPFTWTQSTFRRGMNSRYS